MNRRGFLSVITMGAVATPAAAMGIKESSDPSDGPICTENLTLRSGTKKKNVKESAVDCVSFIGDNYEEYKQVSMAVGKDGNLWIKTEEGQWKRVVTE